MTTSGRVNRARDLLKSFEGEGDKVTESQINMLDHLLQEKEEKRRMEYQQSLKESDQQRQKQAESVGTDSTRQLWQQQSPEDFESTQITNIHQLADEEIEEKNELLESEVDKLTMRSGIQKTRNRNRGQDRNILKSMADEGDRVEERKLNTIFSDFLDVKSETRVLATKHPEVVMKTDKLSAYADHIVSDAEIPEETKEVYLNVRRVEKGYPVKEVSLKCLGPDHCRDN
ncbi:inner centromere protein-like [Ptychodera flava]|uniref:inner centromere protein-like n=1 Tax=Ptychodera flava TaxID=63121 RepID=UPI003969C8F3